MLEMSFPAVHNANHTDDFGEGGLISSPAWIALAIRLIAGASAMLGMML